MTHWLIALLFALQAAVPTQTPPRASITNGRIQATLLLPDAVSGYYRGTRFDWSGQIESLTIDGHEYFGQWFERYDPLLHDAIMGPVEEFLSPGDSSTGYDVAPVGGVFMRIGVGGLRKPEEAAYRRFGTYEIVEPGAWTVEKGDDRITFEHTLRVGAYAYVYRKVVRLDGAQLILDHSLRNTGTTRITTSVYNHNFFTLDRQPTGPDVVVRFPFDPKPTRDLGERATFRGRDFVFLKTLEKGETTITEVEGFGPTADDYDFRIEHRATGAAVRIMADRPMQKIVFWTAPKTVCPEPYIDVSVDPGQETTWRNTYTFGS